MVLNSDVLEPRGSIRVSTEPPNSVVELVAVPPDAYDDTSTGGRETCCVANQFHDIVLLRLARPVTTRGFARVRAHVPTAGTLLPVIHNPPVSDRAKRFVVAEVRPTPTLLRPLIVLFGSELTAATASSQLGRGSSGAPLFDEEGYLIGVYSTDCTITGGCHAFTPIASTIDMLGGALSAAPETSASGLGRFTVTPLSGLVVRATSFGAQPERPLALVARPDGTFVTAGYATSSSGEHVFALVGYDAAGELDASFGGGRVSDDVSGSRDEELVDLAVQAVGAEHRLVAVGNLSAPDDVAVVRYTPSGVRDTTFGEGGLLRFRPGDVVPNAAAIAVDPSDDSIVVAGDTGVRLRSFEDRPFGSPFVLRLDRDGGLASRCGGAGMFVWRPVARFDPPLTQDNLGDLVTREVVRTYDMVVRDVAIDDRGRILLAGHLTFGNLHARSAWVGRLTDQCQPDPSFGPNGSGVMVVPTTSFAPLSETSWASSVIPDPITGRIFVGGTWARFEPSRGLFAGGMFVTALLADGALDTSFGFVGSPGGALVPREAWHEETNAMALSSSAGQPFLVLAGEAYGLEPGFPRPSLRRARMAIVSANGTPLAFTRPANALGTVQQWATDVVLGPGEQPVVALAILASPVDPFQPDP